MKDKIFIFIVCSILLFFALCSPVIATLSKAGYLDALSTKNLIVNEKVYDEDLPAAEFFTMIEEGKVFLQNVYINCIPFYKTIVSSVQSAEMSLLKVTDGMMQSYISASAPAPVTVAPETESGVGGGETSGEEVTEAVTEAPKINYISLLLGGNGRPSIYSIEPLKVMERVEGASDKALQRLTERQLRHIHRLKESTPGINYYIYMGTRLQETDMFEEMVAGPSSTKKYFDYFVENLDKDIKFDCLRLETPEDRVNKKYRSDHHWNMFGAYEGYRQIINMIYEDSPEIGPPVDYDIIKVPNIRWFGSLGQTVGQTDMGYADDFYILDLTDFPKYSGNGYRIAQMQERFMSGEFDSYGLYADYYGTFYPPQDRYVFNGNDTGHNLLLLGDSFSWSIAAVIASHFDTTICHNKPWLVGANVTYDYPQYLKDHNITDVLILLYSSRLLFGYDSTDFERMLTP